MGNLDRQLYPTTLDYVAATAGGGKFEEVEVIENQIVLAFSVALGSWEGDPDFGHRFGELARATDTAENRQRLADFARLALKFLIDDGSLESVDVAVEHYDAGKVAFAVDAYRPGQTTAIPLPTFLVPVGAA